MDTLRKRAIDEHPDIYKNLMAFARDSLVFEGCIANSSWTLASHASLFTGLAVHEHGAEQMKKGPSFFGGEQPIRSLGQEFPFHQGDRVSGLYCVDRLHKDGNQCIPDSCAVLPKFLHTMDHCSV